MRVKLLNDFLEGGAVKVTANRSKKTGIFWFKDTEIDVSEASGQKLIEAGAAVEVAAVAEEK